MKVYIVSEGQYSDLSIFGVFSTEEKAKECIEYWQKAGSSAINDDIEEYELDNPECFDSRIIVWMDSEGNTSYIEASNSEDVGFHRYNYVYSKGSHTYIRVGSTEDKEEIKTLYLVCAVKTADKERAVKVVNEKRAMIIANNCWGNTEKTKQLFQ